MGTECTNLSANNFLTNNRISADNNSIKAPGSPFAKIAAASKKDSSLSDCMSGIDSILDLLSHKDKDVRDAAASVIASLSLKAAGFLQNVKDLQTIEETKDFLLDAISQVNRAELSPVTYNSVAPILYQAKSLVNEKAENPNKKDEFVPYNRDDFSKVASANMSTMPRGFDTGGTTYDSFVSSTNQSMKNLIGRGSKH